METRKYKTMTENGNIAFFSWSRAGLPESSEDVRRYGKHLATFFPENNEWYNTKISRPERFEKI